MNTDASQRDSGQREQSLMQLKSLKPRTSDAILSCPCCFEIVCMDCQRHERYSNQFRAMFVMNIGVSWDVTICPEDLTLKNTDVENSRSLDPSGTKKARISTATVVDDRVAASNTSDQEAYFSVHCNKCLTVVAGLDMRDEVYHFFGCLATG